MLTKRPKKMSFLSLDVETIQRVCESAAIIAGVVTALALIGQIKTGRIINARQARQIRELDIKRLELEREVSPRRLTGNQKESLTKLLSGKSATFAIVSAAFDPESSDFADDLDAALREIHWKTVRIKNRLTTAYGVVLGEFGESEKPSEAVQWLSDGLRSIGIKHEIKAFDSKEKASTVPEFQEGVLYLVVERKPPYKQEK